MPFMPIRTSTIALLAVASFVSPVAAYTYGPYGCNLRWDQCYGDGGPINKNFACNTNAGSQKLVASFVPAWDVGSVVGMEYIILMAADAPSVPAWWQFKNVGTCRRNILTASFVNANPTGACPDWSAQQQGGTVLTVDIEANGMRLLVSEGSVSIPPQNLVGRQEYFGFNFVVPNVGTVGTPSCAGCSTPVCIVFSAANIRTKLASESKYLTGPANMMDSDYSTWQGGGNPTIGPRTGCPAATPTKPSTWGAVKSLYR